MQVSVSEHCHLLEQSYCYITPAQVELLDSGLLFMGILRRKFHNLNIHMSPCSWHFSLPYMVIISGPTAWQPYCDVPPAKVELLGSALLFLRIGLRLRPRYFHNHIWAWARVLVISFTYNFVISGARTGSLRSARPSRVSSVTLVLYEQVFFKFHITTLYHGSNMYCSG